MFFVGAILLSAIISFIPYASAKGIEKSSTNTDELKNTNSKINVVNQCHNDAVCIAQVIQNYCVITNDPTTCGQRGGTIQLGKGQTGPVGPITGTILLKVKVDNTKGGTLNAHDFSVGVEGTSPLPQQFQGSEPYTIIQIGKGKYNVSQEIENGYSL